MDLEAHRVGGEGPARQPRPLDCTLALLDPNLGNFMRTLAMPKTGGAVVADQLARKAYQAIKLGGKVVSHGRYVTFQRAEAAVSRQMFNEILSLIARLRLPPAPA